MTLPMLHLNHKANKGTVDGSFFTESQLQLLEDFNFIAQRESLFGLVSAFPASPQNLNDQSAEVLYGGLFYSQDHNVNASLKLTHLSTLSPK